MLTLQGADLTRAKIIRATLDGTDFTDATLLATALFGCRLREVKGLSVKSLSRACFYGAQFTFEIRTLLQDTLDSIQKSVRTLASEVFEEMSFTPAREDAFIASRAERLRKFQEVFENVERLEKEKRPEFFERTQERAKLHALFVQYMREGDVETVNGIRRQFPAFEPLLFKSFHFQDDQGKLKNVKSGLSLREMSLQGIDLHDAYANFTEGATCAKVSFQRANFEKSALQMSNFTDCDFRGVNFNGARLEYVDFGGSDLRGADFTDARLSGASFINTDLSGVKGLTAEQLARTAFYGAKVDPALARRALQLLKASVGGVFFELGELVDESALRADEGKIGAIVLKERAATATDRLILEGAWRKFGVGEQVSGFAIHRIRTEATLFGDLIQFTQQLGCFDHILKKLQINPKSQDVFTVTVNYDFGSEEIHWPFSPALRRAEEEYCQDNLPDFIPRIPASFRIAIKKDWSTNVVLIDIRKVTPEERAQTIRENIASLLHPLQQQLEEEFNFQQYATTRDAIVGDETEHASLEKEVQSRHSKFQSLIAEVAVRLNDREREKLRARRASGTNTRIQTCAN